jgi:hypothetical protein
VVKRAQALMDVLLTESYQECDLGSKVTRWTLPKGVVWMGPEFEERDLYERECWRKIVELCKEELSNEVNTKNRGVSVGHVPGIGKSMFLNRLLVFSLKCFRERCVLFYDRGFKAFVLFDWKARRVTAVADEQANHFINDSSQRDTLIVVDDPSGTNRGPAIFGPPYFAAASGKAQMKMKEDIKQAHLSVVTMDPLSEDEAITMLHAIAGVPEVNAKELYAEWGGSLRHLLAAWHKANQQYRNDRESAFSFLGGPMTVHSVMSMVKKSDIPSHYLLHEFASSDLRLNHLYPASHHVAHRLFTSLAESGRNQLADFLSRLDRSSPHYWWGFEELVHIDLSKGGEFTLHSAPGPAAVFDVTMLNEMTDTDVSLTFRNFPFKFKKETGRLFSAEVTTSDKANKMWENASDANRQVMLQAGIQKQEEMNNKSKHHAKSWVHLRKPANVSHLQLPPMKTVPVRDVADVVKAIEEWRKSGQQASWFKPSSTSFPCIDAFALVPMLNPPLSSTLVLFQMYAGKATRKPNTGLEALVHEFVKAGVLARDQAINLVLVVPRDHLHFCTTLQFKEEEPVRQRIHEWKLLHSPTPTEPHN